MKKVNDHLRASDSKFSDSEFLQPQQQAQSSALGGVIKGVWKQQLGAAKVVWGRLTDDEILQTEGNLEKLSGLVQERYAVNRNEADQQVRRFLRQA